MRETQAVANRVDWVIIIYALFFQFVSFVFAMIAVKILRFPQWIV
jgi:hypothetical protein